jgi:Protein of unknown function (DUF3617)
LKIFLASLVSLAFASSATAQTPGEWKYTIATDMASVPEDMRVNFPTVSFTACRTAADFESGAAFFLQTLASSASRCTNTGYERLVHTGSAKNKIAGDTIGYAYACDVGSTLRGKAIGSVEPKRFNVALNTQLTPSVSGVENIRQTMSAQYVGACKVQPDVDLIKTQ